MPSKWLRDHRQQDLRDHKKRIENMRSTIDTSAPREMPMSKRNEIERERKRALVEQDNRLLLDRLALAMSTKNIDNVLVEKPFISLMELQRKKQLKKIMIQNSRLLERIQCTVPSYDHVVWEKEAEHHVGILRNMTEFPDLFVPPGCHKKGYDMAIVDAERAQLKALQQGRSAERGGTASPEERRQGGKPSATGDHSPSSPSQQGKAASGFVPYSYFPEEQYAQYQMQLQIQQQQMLAQGQHGGQVYGTAVGVSTTGLSEKGGYNVGVSGGSGIGGGGMYGGGGGASGDLYAGTSVPFSSTLSPEQQYAHQQQMFLYHQQQQQRLNYNTNATATINNSNSNVPYYAQPPPQSNNYIHHPYPSQDIQNPPYYPQQQGVQLPNIYDPPPGHVAHSSVN